MVVLRNDVISRRPLQLFSFISFLSRFPLSSYKLQWYQIEFSLRLAESSFRWNFWMEYFNYDLITHFYRFLLDGKNSLRVCRARFLLGKPYCLASCISSSPSAFMLVFKVGLVKMGLKAINHLVYVHIKFNYILRGHATHNQCYLQYACIHVNLFNVIVYV